MKKAVVLISIALLLAAALAISVSKRGKGIPHVFVSDPALYVHAVSGSGDTEAWQKWQSVHDEDFEEERPEEKYFFLPSSAGENITILRSKGSSKHGKNISPCFRTRHR